MPDIYQRKAKALPYIERLLNNHTPIPLIYKYALQNHEIGKTHVEDIIKLIIEAEKSALDDEQLDEQAEVKEDGNESDKPGSVPFSPEGEPERDSAQDDTAERTSD